MKALILLFVVLAAVGCNSNGNSNTVGKDIDTISASSVEAGDEAAPVGQLEFPGLYDFFTAQDPDFSPAAFEGGELVQKDTIAETAIDTASLRPFRPYLVYNNDSTKAIDFISRHYLFTRKGLEVGDPDSEAALLDFQKGTRKRLLYTGPSTTIMEAAWLKDGSVMIAGAEDLGEGRIRPLIWKFSAGNKMFYTYTQEVHADIDTYTRRLLQRGNARTSPSF